MESFQGRLKFLRQGLRGRRKRKEKKPLQHFLFELKTAGQAYESSWGLISKGGKGGGEATSRGMCILSAQTVEWSDDRRATQSFALWRPLSDAPRSIAGALPTSYARVRSGLL